MVAALKVTIMQQAFFDAHLNQPPVCCFWVVGDRPDLSPYEQVGRHVPFTAACRRAAHGAGSYAGLSHEVGRKVARSAGLARRLLVVSAIAQIGIDAKPTHPGLCGAAGMSIGNAATPLEICRNVGNATHGVRWGNLKSQRKVITNGQDGRLESGDSNLRSSYPSRRNARS